MAPGRAVVRIEMGRGSQIAGQLGRGELETGIRRDLNHRSTQRTENWTTLFTREDDGGAKLKFTVSLLRESS
jgi:hypothetical protein